MTKTTSEVIEAALAGPCQFVGHSHQGYSIKIVRHQDNSMPIDVYAWNVGTGMAQDVFQPPTGEGGSFRDPDEFRRYMATIDAYGWYEDRFHRGMCCPDTQQ